MSDTSAPTQSPSTDAGASTQLVLGRGMAHRAMPQSMLRPGRIGPGLVGAIGRASLGFGLAVGRSRSVQPTVRRADLNSFALRPPPNFWLEDEPDDAVAVDQDATTRPSAASEPATRPAAADTDRRPGRTVRRTPTRRSSGAPPATSRRPVPTRPTTWTDRVIARAGRNADARGGAAVAAPEAAPTPEPVVSTGDPRLDELRMLLQAQRDGVDLSVDEPDTPPEPVGRTAASDRPPPPETSAPTAPGDTSAGPRTAPGQLSRSLAPETAREEHPAVARAAAPGTSVSRRPQRRDRLDDLREAMREAAAAEAGPSDAGGADEGSEPDADRRAQRRERTSAPSGGGSSRTPSSDRGVLAQRRAAAGDIARRLAPPTPGPSRPGGDGGNTPTGAPDARGADADPPGAPERGETPAPSSTDGDPAAGSGPAHAGNAAIGDGPTARTSALIRRASRTMLATGGSLTDRLEADVDRLGDAAADLPSDATVPEAPVRPAAVGLLDHESDTPAASLPGQSPGAESRSASVERAARRSTSGRIAGPTTGSASAVARSTTGARATAPSVPAEQPVLPGAARTELASFGIAPAATIRRVTLPRALSSSHRPDAVRGDAVPAIAPPTTGSRRASGGSDRSVANVPSSPSTAARVSGRASDTSPDASDIGNATIRRSEAASADRVAGSDRAPVRPAVSHAGDQHPTPGTPGVRPDNPREPAASAGSADATPTPRRRPRLRSSSRLEVSPESSEFVGTARTPGRASGAAPHPNRLLRALRSSVGSGTADVVGRTVADVPLGTAPAVAGDPAATAVVAAHDVQSAEVRRVADDAPARSDAVADVMGGTATVPTELGRRFLAELDAQRRSTPAALPASYRPMAETIAGTSRVMLSTDTASRRALRSVGKVAATTDDVIHLDPTAVARTKMDEVVAHELTHVAHPSPAPRFFDDEHESAEERTAERVAELIARSPLAPNAPVQRSGSSDVQSPSAPPRPAGSPRTESADVIRRTPATAGRSPASPSPSGSTRSGGVSADELAAQITGDPAPTIRRAAEPSPFSASASASLGNMSASASTSTPDTNDDVQDRDDDFRSMLHRHADLIERLIEERVRDRLERRGDTWRYF